MGAGSGASLGLERRQRGGEHQNLGLHEGEVGQTGDDPGRLLAQVLVFPRLPGGGAGLLHGGHEAGEGVGDAAAGAASVHLGRRQLEQFGVDA